jgi:ornithine cyclodeaminase
MRMVDGDQVHALLDYPGLIDALRQGHVAGVDQAQSTLLTQALATGGENSFLALPAWQHDEALGIKVVTVFPENLAGGGPLPSVQAVYLLFDGKNGEPLACIDGTALTLRKTAADSGLGAWFLARRDSASLLMVGAGALGPHVIQAHLAARPSITRVRVWNRSHERAEALAAGLTIPGVAITATRDLEAAARQADVIACATMAVEPLIAGAWLKPGCHLDLIGSFTPQMREADDEAVRRASVFGDSRARILADSGEIIQSLASGALRDSDIRGDLYELARGDRPGRRSEEEITLFKNAGGGHLDLMTARHLMARRQG